MVSITSYVFSGIWLAPLVYGDWTLPYIVGNQGLIKPVPYSRSKDIAAPLLPLAILPLLLW